MPRPVKSAIARRQIFQTLAAGVAVPAQAAAQTAALPLDDVRGAAQIHGLRLSPERLAVLRPILEQRRQSLSSLRALRIDDSVEPSPGPR